MTSPRKYRGIRVDNGEWVYGWYVQAGTQHFISCESVGEHSTEYDAFVKTYALAFFVEVIPETVGQYTGLKDENGVEIYEGDVVEYYQYSRICSKCAHRDKIIDVVKFNSLGVTLSSYRIIDPMSDISEVKVIGNIHQNPELLETDK